MTAIVRPIDPATPGYFISQVWGQLSGYARGVKNPGGVNGHPGVDYAVGYATPVRAMADFEVIWARPMQGFGPYMVSLWHPEIGMSTGLGHMMRMDVFEGQTGKAGQVVGGVNSMGQSTGNHLHGELRPFRAPSGANPQNIDMEAFLVLHETGIIKELPKLTDQDRAYIKRMQYLLGVPQTGVWKEGDRTDVAYQTLRWKTLVNAKGQAVVDLATHAKVVRMNLRTSTTKAMQHDIFHFSAAQQDGILGPNTDAAWQLCRLCWLNK